MCLAAVLAALIVGFNALKMTAAERPTVKEATIAAAKPTESASGDDGSIGKEIAQQLHSLGAELTPAKKGHAGEIAIRAVEAAHKAGFDRVITRDEHDRDGGRGSLGRWYYESIAHDRCYLPPHQLGGKRRQVVELIVRPMLFEFDVMALNEILFF
jgi:hypothetical protein